MIFYLDLENKELIVSTKENSSLNNCDKFKKLTANDTDAAKEKHVPIIECDQDIVKVIVGSTLHPMSEEHLIEYIILETTQGYMLKKLPATNQPLAEFNLSNNERVIAAYEYCNLHGLWVTRL